MPLYEFRCLQCGSINEFLVSLAVLPKNKRRLSLKKLGLACKRCRSTAFIKIISAHSKTAQNWGSWADSPTPPPKPKRKKS